MAGRFRVPLIWRLDRRPAPAEQADKRRDQEQHHGHEEDDLCDFDREARDSAESEHSSDQRNDQERQSPTEHDGSPHECAALTAALGRKRLRRTKVPEPKTRQAWRSRMVGAMTIRRTAHRPSGTNAACAMPVRSQTSPANTGVITANE